MIETVRLKNGSEEAKAMVTITMKGLKRLAANNPLALYDLAMRCKGREYQWFGDNRDFCEKLSLMLPNNHVHDSVKNVVLSAVTIEGSDFNLNNPIESIIP